MIKIDFSIPAVQFFIKIALSVYLGLLFYVLFIGIGTLERDTHFENPNDHFVPMQSTLSMVRRASIYDFRGEPMYVLILNIIGNLCLLAPWGILAPLVFSKLASYKNIGISAFLISFSAETIQYIFSIGIFDIDDLLFNTIGAVCGFFVLQLSGKYFRLPDYIGSYHL